jgi:hypothetical protein
LDNTPLTDSTKIGQNGATRPTALSSTSSLFWRIFVPAFTSAILIAALMVLWLTPEDDLYLSHPAIWYRLCTTVLCIGWIYFMYRTLWRLRRIDADPAFVYITDYWITARYPWADVKGFSESRHLGRRIAHIHLHGSGKFGNKISFLPNKDYKTWVEEHVPLEPSL